MVHLSSLFGGQSSPFFLCFSLSCSQPFLDSSLDKEMLPFLKQFSCQNLSIVSVCQEIDFLPGKSRNFRQLAMQSISLDKLSCFPAKKIDLKNRTITIL